jgi:hypothetical protein
MREDVQVPERIQSPFWFGYVNLSGDVSPNEKYRDLIVGKWLCVKFSEAVATYRIKRDATDCKTIGLKEF